MLTFSFFSKYLFSRRSGALIRIISWLCVGGIAVGVFAFILVLSIMSGLHRGIQDRFLNVEPHLVVHLPEVNDAETLSESDLFLWLKKEPEVETYIFEQQDVMLRTADGLFGGAIAKGVDEESLKKIFLRLSNAEGETVKLPKWFEDFSPGEVLVGSELASSLAILEGDAIIIIPPESLLLPPGEVPTYDRAVVRKIISTNVADIDSKMMFYIRGKTLRRLTQAASVDRGMELWLKDARSFSGLETRIKGMGARVESWQERNSVLFHALFLEKLVIGIFLALAGLIASFSIVTVLALLLSQKRRDIGIMMALGLSPKQTQKMYRHIGLMLAGIGLGTGLPLALLACFFLEKYKIKLPDIYYETKIPVEVDAKLILFSVVACLLLAFIGSWLPTLALTRLLPTEALRSKVGKA